MLGAYGARHARAKPSVMQWVLAVRETVVIKPSRINIVAQAPYLLSPPFPSLALIHTPLFLWALIRLQASGLAESITRKKIGRTASALHTHRHASLVSRYTTLVPFLKLCIGPDFYAGFSQGCLTWL